MHLGSLSRELPSVHYVRVSLQALRGGGCSSSTCVIRYRRDSNSLPAVTQLVQEECNLPSSPHRICFVEQDLGGPGRRICSACRAPDNPNDLLRPRRDLILHIHIILLKFPVHCNISLTVMIPNHSQQVVMPGFELGDACCLWGSCFAITLWRLSVPSCLHGGDSKPFLSTEQAKHPDSKSRALGISRIPQSATPLISSLFSITHPQVLYLILINWIFFPFCLYFGITFLQLLRKQQFEGGVLETTYFSF